MLQRIVYSEPGSVDELDKLLHRESGHNEAVEQAVGAIIAGVRSRGDQALIEYTRQHDQYPVSCMESLQLDAQTIADSHARLDDDLRDCLEVAAGRIRAFHQREMLHSWSYTEPDGTKLGQIVSAMERVGVYVPGGKAAYPSSVLMTVIPAKVAGVNEIIMTAPAPGGEINDTVVAAAHIAGVDRIYTIGGAQAVAALAYGTETVPRVDKIVGPGNTWVATAKKMVFGDVGIDMIAGPSEVVVICDESANPDWVAMDLFAQAEHDELAQSIAITPSKSMADRIIQSIDKLIAPLQRKEIIRNSLSDNGGLVLVEDLAQAVEVANHIAPEHLELMVENAADLVAGIKHAGAIFVGKYSAEVLGDYCAGPNHVLPTSGTARFSSPLGVYDFQKRSSLIQVSGQGASQMAATAARLAHSEGLTAHEQSARYRIESSHKSGNDELQ